MKKCQVDRWVEEHLPPDGSEFRPCDQEADHDSGGHALCRAHAFACMLVVEHFELDAVPC